LFAAYPTGFAIFPVGHRGSSYLTFLQSFAALGGELRGKKVAISSTPGVLVEAMLSPQSYSGSFSRLDAGELAFSTELSLDLKRDVARRMLQYPDTLRNDPLV